MEELQVRVEQSPGIIKFNFQEIKEALQVQMTAYTSLEITESDSDMAKNDLATLRKIRKAVEDEKKAVKAEFQKPLKEFEDNVKELLAVIDEPIEMIDGRLKEFDAKRIAEKQTHLKELYDANIGDYAEYLPYEAVASPKWNNKTYSDKDIVYDISEAVIKVRSDIDVIKSLGSEIEKECLDVYKKSNNDLKAAIQKNNDYLSTKKLVEEKVKEETKAEEKKEVELPKTEEETIYFKIVGADNIKVVRDFIALNGMTVEEIPG